MISRAAGAIAPRPTASAPQPVKKQTAVVMTSGGASERFLTDEPSADRVIAALKG
jgi:hypothetical protein